MKENPFNKKFADAVRQSFDDYSEDPSAADLEKLRSSLDQLDKPAPVYGFGFRTAGSAFWLRAAAGFALLFSILGMLLYIFSERNLDKVQIASSEQGLVYQSPGDGLSGQYEIADAFPLAEVETADTLAERSESGIDGNHIAVPGDEIKVESEPERAADLASRVNDIHEIPSAQDQMRVLLPVPDFAEKQDSSIVPDIVFLPSSTNGSVISGNDQNISDMHSSGKEDVNSLGSISQQNAQISRASLTLGTSTVYTSDGLAGGVGISAGALRQWSIVPRLKIVAGGLLNFNQFSLSNEELSQQLDGIIRSTGTINEQVNFQTRYTQLALEVPVQAFYDLFQGRRSGTFSVGAGLASRLYMLESEMREGVRYEGEFLTNPENGSFSSQITTSEFSESSQTGAFQHLDTARLLYVSFVYETRTFDRPISIELYTKHPLGDLTSSDIRFGTTGLTFRYGIW